MNGYEATEQAYKNGYAKGILDAIRHGRWTFKSIGACRQMQYECSVCKNTEASTSDFCPNCGARMDGESIA